MLIEEEHISRQALPELSDILNSSDVMSLESLGSLRLAELFKNCGAPGLIIPKDLGGLGHNLTNAVKILRYTAYKYPSLSIAMTMHHHGVGAFIKDAIQITSESELLRGIATESKLLATAFSELRPSLDILHSTVNCKVSDDCNSVEIDGEKKPCTLSEHFDYALIGVIVNGDAGQRGMVVAEKGLSGISVDPFWSADVFKATGSHCLKFKRVSIPIDNTLLTYGRADEITKARFYVTHAETTLSCIFQLMLCASYLGIASRLAEYCVADRKTPSSVRLKILSALESSVLSVYQLASILDNNGCTAQTLTKSMLISRSVIDSMASISSYVSGNLSSKLFLVNEEVRYLMQACNCINYHPPKDRVREELIDNIYVKY
jgi:hypothetical protein